MVRKKIIAVYLTRLSLLFALGYILNSNQNYWAAIVFSIESLLMRKRFFEMPQRDIYQLGFVLYTFFVVWERTRGFTFSQPLSGRSTRWSIFFLVS
jgi:uncharacterized protein involved in cysteine biosynthesis